MSGSVFLFLTSKKTTDSQFSLVGRPTYIIRGLMDSPLLTGLESAPSTGAEPRTALTDETYQNFLEEESDGTSEWTPM